MSAFWLWNACKPIVSNVCGQFCVMNVLFIYCRPSIVNLLRNNTVFIYVMTTSQCIMPVF